MTPQAGPPEGTPAEGSPTAGTPSEASAPEDSTPEESAPEAAPAAAPRPASGTARGSRLALAGALTAVLVGLGLVGTALAGGTTDAPVEPPRTTVDASAPLPGAGDGAELPAPPEPSPGRAAPEPTEPVQEQLLPPAEPSDESLLAPAEPVVAEPEVVEPVPVAEPTRLRVPSIDVDTDLLHLGLNDDGTMAVPPRDGEDNLKASWYDGSPRAGEVGPSVYAGHIDSRRGPSVFYRLGELEPGDEVHVDRADGTTATFVVDGSERFPKDEFPTTRVYGSTDDAQIRLITCGGEFDRSSGHYLDNTVVYGHLVEG